MTKNIALVIGQLSLGGSEKQLYLLAKGLKKSNNNVLVIVLSSIIEPYGNMLKKEGIRVVSLRKKLPYFDLIRIIDLRRKFKKYKINIIYSYSLTANYYSFFSILFKRNITFISGSRNVETDRGSFLKLIDDIIIRNSNALITNSESNLEHIKKISNNPELINGFIIKNGIDIKPEDNYDIKENKKNITIGTIALFKKQKNYPLFIDLCNSITNKYKNISFTSIGTGPEFEKMVLYAKSNSLDGKLKFMGNQINAAKIMSNNFDIFVLTSYKEGMPNVVMEAMSYGLPVVATDVGGVSELIHHNKTGFLVSSNDLKGLVKYCKILIESPSLRKDLGKRGKKFIEDQFSSEKMLKEFEDVFNNLN